MSEPQPTDPESDRENTTEPACAKRRYVKPAVRSESTFEIRALSCGKTGPVEQQCTFNRSSS